MAHILRLHPDGPQTNTDWQGCQPYGTNVISQIVAPNGATAKKEITSIPSPFARIALVKSAFGEVVKSGNLNGTTIYHKMVSDCWDVAEIFFNYDRLNKPQEKFLIVPWDAQNDLAALQGQHQEIYNSLDVFLRQDAAVYNFGLMQRIYILVYVGQYRKTQMDVVGATSPASLFFTSANDLSYLSPDISFGQDHPFDGKYQPLHLRDHALVEYLFAFRAANQQFAVLFPEVDQYLNMTFSALTPNMKNVVSQLSPTSLAQYSPLQINGTNSVEILGQPLHKKILQPVGQSGFFISQSKYSGKTIPMVLPVESGNDYANLHYVTAPWGKDNAAPYSDKTPWQKRSLPADGTPHPYLTISDFLEDTIIKVGYKANAGRFFFGQYDDTDNSSILLPLKPLFFEFFSVQQLMQGTGNGPMIQINTINGGDITVQLNIPINGGIISYRRNYYQNLNADIDKNRGAVKTISDLYFGIGMLPMSDTENPYYRIGIAHDFGNAEKHGIECYRDGTKIDNISETVRNRSDKHYVKTHIFSVDNDPVDMLRVQIGNTWGMAIPIYNQTQRNLAFSFAVDFGTSNTHIEYTAGDNAAKSFDDKQLIYWSNTDVQSRHSLEENIMPEEIGKDFYFPTRTALSEAATTDWQQPVTPMAQTSLSYVYGHRQISDYNTITTDLKWSNDPTNILRVKSYIENLMLTMRNKVLLGGGQLQNTRIVWFYPSSMTTARRNTYQNEWNSAYQKYFGTAAGNICAVQESVAPYEYFRQTNANASRMVTVDIGGGTTDVVIAENGHILYTTSFRFAADNIFGDGHVQNGPINGMVQKYISIFEKLLKNNGLSELSDILKGLKNKGRSADLASFFFSVMNDSNVKKGKAQDLTDWNKMLQGDDDFRVVFLLFYSAIIYHIAHIMKGKGLALPRHIAFSGNGAKTLSVLTPNIETLSAYTQDIFCRIYERAQYDADGLDVILTDNPKAATCKGGLNILSLPNRNIPSGEEVVLKGGTEFVDPLKDKYASIDESLKDRTIKEVQDFLVFTLAGNSRFSIKEKLGIEQSSLNKAMEVCNRDLKTFLGNGIERKMQEVAPDDPIEETLFFYPLVEMLHTLCESIYSGLLSANN